MMSSTSASPSVIDRNSSRDGNNENGNENESGRETDATGADASDEVTIETNNVVLLRNYNNDDGDGDGDGGVIVIRDNDSDSDGMALIKNDSRDDDDEDYSSNHDDDTRISIRSCLPAAEMESRITFTSHSCLLDLCLAM